jgi:hypothetical protein
MASSRKRVLGFVERWNWKAAVLSIIGRAPIFLITTYAYGWRSATLAAGVETTYCAGTAGVFAGLIQTVRSWRPVWVAALLITVGIPVFSQGLDYSVHYLIHTPNLRTGTLASFAFSEISALFNWYSMQRGSFLVGSEQDSFLTDLCRLPRLILGFVLAPPTWMWRCTRQVFVPCGGEHDD